MRRPEFATAALCVLAFMLCATTARAAGKGSISGTIRDTSGRPVVGIRVRLHQDEPMAAPRGGDKPPAGKKANRKPVAEANTDKDGKFVFTNLEPGVYLVMAGSRNIGWIYVEVEVKADEETKLGDTKLVKPQ